MVLSLTLFSEEIFGVGTSLGASGLIISYPLGTFFSSLEGRNMINPDALEAGPYPDRRIDEKMCR